MLNSKQLQNSYNKLYKSLRQYIWPYNIVEMIANLEVSVYRSFPDLDEVEANYLKLKGPCLRMIRDDEDLETAFDKFYEIFKDEDTLYAKLNARTEGVK